jgi:hypothetical protein
LFAAARAAHTHGPRGPPPGPRAAADDAGAAAEP